MRLRLIPSFLGAALLAVAACGGGSSNYVLPVDSPIKPFKAPSDDELTGQKVDPLATPTDDDDFEPVMPPDMNDNPSEEGGDDAAKPPATKTAPAPAAAPAPATKPAPKAKPKAGKKG